MLASLALPAQWHVAGTEQSHMMPSVTAEHSSCFVSCMQAPAASSPRKHASRSATTHPDSSAWTAVQNGAATAVSSVGQQASVVQPGRDIDGSHLPDGEEPEVCSQDPPPASPGVQRPLGSALDFEIGVDSPSLPQAGSLPIDQRLIDAFRLCDEPAVLGKFLLKELENEGAQQDTMAAKFIQFLDETRKADAAQAPGTSGAASSSAGSANTGSGRTAGVQETHARTGSAAATKKTFKARHAQLERLISRKDATDDEVVNDFVRHVVAVFDELPQMVARVRGRPHVYVTESAECCVVA